MRKLFILLGILFINCMTVYAAKIPSDVNKPQFFEENNVQTSWKKDTEFNPPWFWYKNQWSKVMMDEVYVHMKITIANEEHNCISILRDYEYEMPSIHSKKRIEYLQKGNEITIPIDYVESVTLTREELYDWDNS